LPNLASDRVFIANTYPGIARAEHLNGGWRVERLLADQDVRALTRDPRRPDVVWAGTQGKGLLRSEDRGRTWQPAGLENQFVKSLAISPSQPDVMAAGLKPPLVYGSRDGGATWTELAGFRKIPSRPFWRSPAEPPGKAYVLGLAIAPTDPDLILAGVEAGALVRSADGGATWGGHRKGAIRDCHTLTFHPTDDRYAYQGGGNGAGAAISRDGGDTWEQPRRGLDRHYGWAVAADPADPEIWYVAVAPGPFRAHSDKGRADAAIFRAMHRGPWERVGAQGGLPQPLNWMPYALIPDPAAPGSLYAGLHNGEVWRSPDHGDSWAQLPFSLGMIGRVMILL
jgi:photosystem II stability/assembly factor-like uncharacterized protein